MKGISIAGRKRNDGIDLYETPEWATRALMSVESFEEPILEPACGMGAISNVLSEKYAVISTDLIQREFGGCVDFFSVDCPCGAVITNPPYVLAEEFIKHAKSLPTTKIAMILKLSFLESEKRKELFADREFPLKTVYVFRKRVQMYPYGIERPKNSGTIAYAWFVWEKGYGGLPIIKWL